MAIFDTYEDSFRLLTFQPIRPTSRAAEVDEAAAPQWRRPRRRRWSLDAVRRLLVYRATAPE